VEEGELLRVEVLADSRHEGGHALLESLQVVLSARDQAVRRPHQQSILMAYANDDFAVWSSDWLVVSAKARRRSPDPAFFDSVESCHEEAVLGKRHYSACHHTPLEIPFEEVSAQRVLLAGATEMRRLARVAGARVCAREHALSGTTGDAIENGA
jgi:hypothetical protein